MNNTKLGKLIQEIEQTQTQLYKLKFDNSGYERLHHIFKTLDNSSMILIVLSNEKESIVVFPEKLYFVEDNFFRSMINIDNKYMIFKNNQSKFVVQNSQKLGIAQHEISKIYFYKTSKVPRYKNVKQVNKTSKKNIVHFLENQERQKEQYKSPEGESSCSLM